MGKEKRKSKPEAGKQSPDILDNIESKMSKIDSILSHLKTILKKHWGTILFILLCAFIYWAWNLPNVPAQEPQQDAQQTESVNQDSTYPDSTYYDSTYTQ